MISGIFKNIGKGIGYFFLFPILVIAIAIYAIVGIFVFIFQFFKMIVLFFSGRNLSSDLPEDVQVKAMLTEDPDEKEEEKKEEENPLSLYPSDSPVYGSGYSSPDFSRKEEPESEIESKEESIEEEDEE